jgi:hypothetical protein
LLKRSHVSSQNAESCLHLNFSWLSIAPKKFFR